MKARTKQIGGDHYGGAEALQPWDIIEACGLDYWEGNVIKYVLRWRRKGGVEDLKKAIHYLEYLIEREERNHVHASDHPDPYPAVHAFSGSGHRDA